MRGIKCYGKELLEKEMKASYYFFVNEVNNNVKSKGYGIVRDKTNLSNHVGSIASTGYGLAAIVIGVKRNWISFEKGYSRVKGTLDTFISNVENINGFYYHFINLYTGRREWNCEVSIIDTAILICGALFAGEFFGGEIKKKAELLFGKINWKWYLNEATNQFYMGYTPEKGFWGKWDTYAEQLMLYVLSTSSPTYPVNPNVYDDFLKPVKNYEDIENIIYTYCGTLFTYQFSHAWIDFRNTKDKNNIDWFENSVKATLANRLYCIKNSNVFKTFGENSWGLTACLGPDGYSGEYGAMPTDTNLNNDGTISPCGAAGSIVFTPELSLKAIENYYNNFPKLWSKYGLKDSYNLEKQKPWYSKEYIGIDKGITLIMIENYLTEFVWKEFMKNKYVKEGLNLIGIKKASEVGIIK